MKKKSKKAQQAAMQTDAIEMAGWSEGVLHGGDTVDGMVTTSGVDMGDSGITYSFGTHNDFGEMQLDLFSEDDLREKYPALKQAHEHYISVLEVCKTKEKEENEN